MSKSNITNSLRHKFYLSQWNKRGCQLESLQPFLTLINDSLPKADLAQILNLGAGPSSSHKKSLQGPGRKVIGLDVDEDVLGNQYLDESYVYDGIRMPFAAETFDVVAADWVLEHVEHPIELFKEIFRVLKAGGVFIARTPNLFHYVSLIVHLTPYSFHKFATSQLLAAGQAPRRTYPTFFRANVPRQLKTHLLRVGFDSVDVRLIEPMPTYVEFNPALYLLGVGYERLVNSSDRLSPFRHAIILKASKKRS